MKKVLWTILSLVVVAALVVGGLRVFNPFMDKHERGAVAEQAQKFQGQERGFKQEQGQQFGYAERSAQSFANAGERGDKRFEQQNRGNRYGEQRGGQRGERKHEGFGGGKIVAVVGDLLLIAAGWALWKRGGRLGRWIGGLLIAVAVLPLLMMAAVVVIPLGLIYLIWRIIRKKRQASIEDFEVAIPLDKPFPTRNNDFLDEWETKTRRELNDKKEEE